MEGGFRNHNLGGEVVIICPPIDLIIGLQFGCDPNFAWWMNSGDKNSMWTAKYTLHTMGEVKSDILGVFVLKGFIFIKKNLCREFSSRSGSEVVQAAGTTTGDLSASHRNEVAEIETVLWLRYLACYLKNSATFSKSADTCYANASYAYLSAFKKDRIFTAWYYIRWGKNGCSADYVIS